MIEPFVEKQSEKEWSSTEFIYGMMCVLQTNSKSLPCFLCNSWPRRTLTSKSHGGFCRWMFVFVPPNSFALARTIEYSAFLEKCWLSALGSHLWRVWNYCECNAIRARMEGLSRLRYRITTPCRPRSMPMKGLAQVLSLKQMRIDVSYGIKKGSIRNTIHCFAKV